MQLIVEGTSGPAAGARMHGRSGDVVSVGRLTLARLGVREDPHMSARHFAIACADDGCHVRDLGSTNGTFLNGARITAAVLSNGDRIEAGTSVFVVRLDTTPSRSHPATPEPFGPVAQSAPEPPPPSPAMAVPTLDVVNDTAMVVGMLPWDDPKAGPRLAVIVKATYRIGSVTLASTQLPLFGSDIVDDQHPLSVRFETDLVPFKPRTDVVLVGRAYAPGRKPVTQLLAGLRVGELRCGVAVIGDRTWQYQPFGSPIMSDPQPFLAMDLVYERAFGGIDGRAGMYCRENLAGTGFIGKKSGDRIDGLRLPNLEDPRHPIHSWDTHPKPVGLGFYGRGWLPRLRLAGTYDDKHMQTRAPAPPEDFSYTFFNGAHPDLQVYGYLRGDEDVVLLNVCPDEPEMHFRLPGVVPKVMVSRWTMPSDRWIEEYLNTDGTLRAPLPLVDETITAVLDTLVFVPDEGIFYEVFRGVCAIPNLDSPEIARIKIGP